MLSTICCCVWQPATTNDAAISANNDDCCDMTILPYAVNEATRSTNQNAASRSAVRSAVSARRRSMMEFLIFIADLALGRLLVRWIQLRRFELDAEFGQRAVERERHLVILVIDGCASVGADIETFIHAEDEWDAVRDRAPRHFLAIDRQHAGATLGESGSIVFEIELDAVFSRRHR